MSRTPGKPKLLDPALVDAESLTFAGVIGRIKAMVGLSLTRRRDLQSALRTLARMINRDPAEIPANINWLHVRLRRVNPASFDISKKRFSNIKSDALKALELAAASRERADWLAPLSPKWEALWNAIHNKHDRWKLSRFMRYCSALQIGPDQVGDETVLSFRQILREETLTNRPDHAVSQMVKTWNRLRETVPAWPDIELKRPPGKREPWTFPLETFPQNFQEDVDRWCDRLGNPDPFEEGGPVKPLRPVTIKHRRFQIRELASALVHLGHDRESITSLAYLVGLSNFKDGLRYLMSRHGDKPTEAIHGLAMGIKAIAQHHVRVSEDQLDAMRGICTRLNREVDGLRAKNRDRLAQFDDDRNLAKLLHLSDELLRDARKKGVRARNAALMLQVAVAVEILLYAPLRVTNLASLHLERHLRWIRNGRNEHLVISIPAHEVKNGKPLAYELGPGSAALVRHYLIHGRPDLLREPSDYLFPAQDGGHREPSGLSNLIKKTIRERTGLIVNAHLFRSIAGKVHSRIVPGDFATLSHVLNDTLRTTMKFYAQFEQKNALRHYQNSVDTLRQQLPVGRKLRRHA